MLKTRRRKGLGDQIAVSKYLDDEFVVRPLGVSHWYMCLPTVIARIVGFGARRFTWIGGGCVCECSV